MLIIALSQALGDGGFFFLAAPFMLFLLPYIMLNYHAMNIVPYLLTRQEVIPKENTWKKYVVPPLTIILVYFVGGLVINVIGAFFSLV